MRRDPTLPLLLAALAFLLVIGPFLPQWALSFVSVALYLGIVVLGMALMMRTGLVSFGQGLYYCLGAYGAGTLDHFYKLSDLLLMVIVGALVAAIVAIVLGFLLAKYRDIFFAMLSLAFSMILYGLLVKTSELGSTDGFGLSVKTSAGIPLGHGWVRYSICAFSAGSPRLCGRMHRYLNSHLPLAGAIRDNELLWIHGRLGTARHPPQLRHCAALAGVGDALMAATIGHVDPETTAN
jgi:branched-chain amino acid transport system permease protein